MAVSTVTISAPQPPAVGSATISGKPGTPLSFSVAVSDPNPVTYSLAGAPSGMTISGTGVVSWPSPVLGTFSVTVIATGFSVHCFGIGPGAGRLMADLVAGDPPIVDPAPFRFSRFGDGSVLKPH